MTRRLLIIILLCLFAGGGGYLWFRGQPKQKISRTIEQFLEHVEHKKISIRKKSDVHQALEEVLAAEVKFQGEFPIPNEVLSPEDTIALIDQFQGLTTLCEITESERMIHIAGSEAQVILTADILVAAGKNHREQQVWELIFDLKETDRWRITGLRGRESD